MNSGEKTSASSSANAAPSAPAPGLNLDDVVFTLFRHKWLIFGFVCLGLAGVGAVRVLRPPLYESRAKLMVRYVVDTKAVNPANPNTSIEQDLSQNVINSEVEILNSLDVAARAADKVGAARILAASRGGNDKMWAAAVVCSGLEVEVPARTPILLVSFKHHDPTVVQPVLQALLDTYMEKHVEVHRGAGLQDVYYEKQREEMRQKLAKTDEKLKELKSKANILFLDDTKHAYQSHIRRLQEDLLDAEGELAQRKAVLGEAAPQALTSATNVAPPVTVPQDKLNEYSFASSEIEKLKKYDIELSEKFKPMYPTVMNVRSQIDKLTARKAQLEQQYPSLASLIDGGAAGGTNASGGLAFEMAEIRKLSAKVSVLGLQLSNIQAQASHILDLEPAIRNLERERDLAETNYNFASSFDLARDNEALAAGKINGLSILESPTPPGQDRKKWMKKLMMLFAGCVGMGLGLAFAIDFVFDRSLRRGVDVERHLHVPAFLTIPDVNWKGPFALPWNQSHPVTAASNGEHDGTLALARWNGNQLLDKHLDGLRERLMTYFEIQDLNLKKPKLVGVTGCHDGAGVSTLAGGLASALSRSGEGNVLLVDMKMDKGRTQSFHNGNPGCGLEQALGAESKGEAQVEKNLFLAGFEENEQEENPGRPLPARFTHLVPKLKASDYEYIIFDMPTVSPTSPTPRLASYMDVTLLVLESGKTAQKPAARALALMRESRASVTAVLNKYRPQVPAKIAQE